MEAWPYKKLRREPKFYVYRALFKMGWDGIKIANIYYLGRGRYKN